MASLFDLFDGWFNSLLADLGVSHLHSTFSTIALSPSLHVVLPDFRFSRLHVTCSTIV